MIDRDIIIMLSGAAIALVSSLFAAVVQHFLSLRADRVKRRRDRLQEVRAQLRETERMAADRRVSSLPKVQSKRKEAASLLDKNELEAAKQAVVELDELLSDYVGLEESLDRVVALRAALNCDEPEEWRLEELDSFERAEALDSIARQVLGEIAGFKRWLVSSNCPRSNSFPHIPRKFRQVLDEIERASCDSDTLDLDRLKEALEDTEKAIYELLSPEVY